MEMNMNTTTTLNEMRDVARQYAEIRQKMATVFAGLPEGKFGAIAEILADIEVNDTTPAVSNLSRVGVARPSATTGDRPSLKNAVTAVLRDAGKTLNGDAIFEELKKRDWLPNTKNPRHYVAVILSSNKDLFLRDAEQGRGFYKLAEGAVVPETPSKAEAEKPVEKEAKPSAKVRAMETPPKVKDAAERVIALLAKTRKPFSITDVAKATKIANHRQVTALVMTMLKRGAVKKLREKNEAKNSLFEVQRAEFNTFVKGLS